MQLKSVAIGEIQPLKGGIYQFHYPDSSGHPAIQMSQPNEESTVEIDEPQLKRTRNTKPRSLVWNHFTKITDKEGITKAKCNHCSTKYVCHTKDHGTSNLNNHLKRCDIYVEKAGFNVPSSEDWVKVRDLCHFLKKIYDVTLRVSGTLYPTSHSCIEDIAEIRIVLNDSLIDHNSQLYGIALAMKEKFDKYFGEVKGMNLLLYFALLLDPRNKKKYFNIVLDDHYGKGKQITDEKKTYIIDELDFLYLDYVRVHSLSSINGSSSSSTILGKRSNPDDMELNPPLPVRSKLREKMETTSIEPTSELEKYFSESVEVNSHNFDILAWWKVNSPRFPTLSLMARDLLAIPVSTVASESVFSTSGRILDAFRSSLTPKIVESLICTQDWIRSSKSAKPEIEEDFDTIQHISKGLGDCTTNGDEE